MKEITSEFDMDDLLAESRFLGFPEAKIRYWRMNSLGSIQDRYSFLSKPEFAPMAMQCVYHSTDPVTENSFAHHTQHTTCTKFRTPHVVLIEDLELVNVKFYQNQDYSWIGFNLEDIQKRKMPGSFVYDDDEFICDILNSSGKAKFWLYGQCLDANVQIDKLTEQVPRGKHMIVYELHFQDDDDDSGSGLPYVPYCLDVQPTFAQ